MSNSTNLNRMSWAIQTLWDAEVRTLDLGIADTLTAVMNVLKQVKEEMVVERNKRLQRDEEIARAALERLRMFDRGQSWDRPPEGS